MDATLFLISAQYVSAARFRDLADCLEAAATGHARAIRLEGEGAGLWAALDALTERGARRITLRPTGLPFSQSLESWLPGAAGRWLSQRGQDAPELMFAGAVQDDPGALAAVANADVPLSQVKPDAGGHLGKGWDRPPSVCHHLLVCTGPRCHAQDAPHLADALRAEIGRQGLSDDVLVTTTGCQFPCNHGATMIHYPPGHWYRIPDKDALSRVVAEGLIAGVPPADLHFHTTGESE